MSETSLPIVSRIIFSLTALGLIAGIVYCNVQPFGLTIQYDNRRDSSKDISMLGPEKRVETLEKNGNIFQKQIDDFAYFTTRLPSRVETANVTVKFQNPLPEQDIYLGFQDDEEWHYDRTLIDASLISSLNWDSVGNDPVLLQRNRQFSSVEAFLADPPDNALVGMYKYDKDVFLSRTKIEQYKPSPTDTIINIPLRGRHTLYAYVEGEPFRMRVSIQDLNSYDGPDPATVRIYKERDLVYEKVIPDDGITDTSGKVLQERETIIQNPGPELPESGVYKVTIDASSDTLIKHVQTNLHKVVFEGPLFLAGNSDAYRRAIKNTTPTLLYSNALALSARTYHSQGIQTLTIGTNQLTIRQPNIEELIVPSDYMNEIIVPLNDIVLNGMVGYFAPSREAFFEPSNAKFVVLLDATDVNLVDYIIAPSIPSRREGDWRIATVTFDLSQAYAKDGQLSWLFLAPQLKENGRHVVVDSIAVELYKKPLLIWNHE